MASLEAWDLKFGSQAETSLFQLAMRKNGTGKSSFKVEQVIATSVSDTKQSKAPPIQKIRLVEYTHNDKMIGKSDNTTKRKISSSILVFNFFSVEKYSTFFNSSLSRYFFCSIKLGP